MECEKFCILRQGVAWFAVPASVVVEVANSPHLARLPQAPPALAGLCHLRNNFVPVISLSALLGEDVRRPVHDPQLLVLSGAQGPWALLVDKVVGLEPLEVSMEVEVRDRDEWTASIMGSAYFKDEIIRVLDPAGLYRLTESALRQRDTGIGVAPTFADWESTEVLTDDAR